MSDKATWNRAEAEQHIGELLDAARTGEPQVIAEQNGEFVVQYHRKKSRSGSASSFLARGGPVED